ncbi:MAG: dUTP diphosphatase [Patescibacteria group bacterium]
MKVNIHLVDPTLPMPAYQTSGSVAFDLYAREDAIIKSREIKLIPTNIIIEVPEGFMFLIASRSSLPLKKGLVLANSVGILDQDYCGPKDEAMLQLLNITGHDVVIKRGERLAQGILVKIEKAELLESVSSVSEKSAGNSRGGFGSTGEF